MDQEAMEDTIFKRLLDWYSMEEAEFWLEAPHPQLHNATPMQYIEAGDGDKVLAILDRLDSGAYL